MKYYKFYLGLMIFVSFAQTAFCEYVNVNSGGQLSSKINLQGAYSISDKANRNPTLSPMNSIEPSPLMFGIQDNTGLMRDTREEINKQIDYAKQQIETPENQD